MNNKVLRILERAKTPVVIGAGMATGGYYAGGKTTNAVVGGGVGIAIAGIALAVFNTMREGE